MNNEWYTPKYIFNSLNIIFDLDVAAPEEGPRYVPCHEYIFEDSLNKIWNGFIWMNPPYGNQKSKILWLDKFFKHGNGICLLPDRTSAPWFQKYAIKSDLICFLSPKVKFEQSNGMIGQSPSNGSVLFAIGTKGVNCVAKSNLGICLKPYYLAV